MSVLLTETGWATNRVGLPPCSEQDKADWTVGAYNSYWYADLRVAGVMPFMLQDAVWGDQYGYEYVSRRRSGRDRLGRWNNGLRRWIWCGVFGGGGLALARVMGGGLIV